MNQTISTDTSGSTPMMIEERSIDGDFFFVFVLALIIFSFAMLYLTKK